MLCEQKSNSSNIKHHSKQELIFSHPLTKPEPKADKVFSKTGNGVHVPGFRFCDCRLKHKTVIKDDYRLSSLPVWSLLPIISGNVWCWQHICDRRHVVFYVASCITRTLRLTSAGRSCVSVVSSSDMVTARRTIRNRIFYPGPFLDYHCFHQSLWFQYH